MILACGVLLLAYLIGAIPFGWLLAKAKGVDIFAAGSGNIGATNVGRVLGRKFGLLVFALDFAKGAIPVALAGTLPTDVQEALGMPHALRVGCAVATFLGHMFPVFLKFRGGKGVATGAGTVFVLVPGPMLLATLAWLAMTAVTRTVSLGSIAAVSMLCVARYASLRAPFADEAIVVTLFVFIGSALLVLKHRANLRRLWAGTENQLEDRPMFHTLAKAIHVLALGLWFGSAVMFNFVAAPTIFASFKDVVQHAPSDRTAHVAIIADADRPQQGDALANALAGSAVGPIFPKFFALQGVCAFFALLTGLAWTRGGKLHKVRTLVLVLAASTVAIGWPLSAKVSELRPLRFSTDTAIAEAAKISFAEWHIVSLLLSFLTAIFAGIALALSAKLPHDATRS